MKTHSKEDMSLPNTDHKGLQKVKDPFRDGSPASHPLVHINKLFTNGSSVMIHDPISIFILYQRRDFPEFYIDPFIQWNKLKGSIKVYRML